MVNGCYVDMLHPSVNDYKYKFFWANLGQLWDGMILPCNKGFIPTPPLSVRYHRRVLNGYNVQTLAHETLEEHTRMK
ncbi:hypothetical protein L2E82_36330 [Cichorium intybus]|uniref:Uncharacterized protein n=1 Tax=Cichorium intybus TaxID=13427 RepID=A0ACB9BR91_CICIN|nr:hypothetical protein L2E82_36330 [Cichorium intybus]